MKLLVDRLDETPVRHDFSATPEWWQQWSAEAGPRAGGAEVTGAVEEAIECRVDAHRMGLDLFLQGELDGELALSCGRCLARYRAPIRERFRLVLEPAGHRVPADPEGAAGLARDGLFLSDELEAGWFQGSEIDLSAFVHEVIALLLPVQPVCRDDCRGLCPRCGADRNVTSCECVEKQPASPFAVLEVLRGGPTGGDER